MVDLSGKRFGRLTVISRAERQEKHIMWLCKCDCGTEKRIRGSHLTGGKIVSCGCFKDENTGNRVRTHGKSKTFIYRVYTHMRGRCCCQTDARYSFYGGRGIKVCEEWLNDFQAFYDWAITNGYQKGLTIDRIDNDGDYEPSNCRWATVKVQANNKSNNHFLEHDGERLTIAQWSDKTGISQDAIERRINLRNWSIERTLTTPMRIRTAK